MLIVSLAALTLIAWIAVYRLVVRPKLVAYRVTAGIYVALNRLEAGWLARALLWAKGLKVLVLGVITSMIPFIGTIGAQLSGVDWSVFVSTERAKLIATIIGLVGVFGPMLMVVIHNGALAEASAAEPVPAPPASPSTATNVKG